MRFFASFRQPFFCVHAGQKNFYILLVILESEYNMIEEIDLSSVRWIFVLFMRLYVYDIVYITEGAVIIFRELANNIIFFTDVREQLYNKKTNGAPNKATDTRNCLYMSISARVFIKKECGLIREGA